MIQEGGGSFDDGFKISHTYFIPSHVLTKPTMKQKILVFQQIASGEKKIAGIEQFGSKELSLQTFSINCPLPPLLDDTSPFLPDHLDADLILDFLTHPDLSYDLATLCKNHMIPLVATGKKTVLDSVISPPI